MELCNKIRMVLLFLCALKCTHCTTPVVMWHGMGDTCCFPFSLGAVKKLIEKQVEEVYVKSLEIGGCLVEDYKSGFFTHPDIQIADVCNQIANDEKLQNGYNAIGFSQGGQFLRAIAQRCPNPPMKNLISIGGQHQGVFGFPYCPSLSQNTCDHIRKLLTYAAYDKLIQRDLVQATYWHDPIHEEKYRNGSTFLADINNEVNINKTYITNLRRLKKFIMVKFINDTIVQPKESQWFEFYKPGQDKEILPLRQSNIYLKNKLGLINMDIRGKLVFLECEGNHLQFTANWFIKNIIPYLR